jgi:hypothetical protein
MMDVRTICRLLDRIDDSVVELERSSTRATIEITLARADLPYLKELVAHDLVTKMKRASHDR